ncbi:MAG: glucose-6-phosphate isomerase [Desulfofustis sp.]|nr:glucose-6-phosphate isomerase [Desulfofustis sp.]
METNPIETAAWQKLARLARDPYDLTVPDALSSRNRIGAMTCRSAGLRLLYATQRVDEQVLAAFQELADQCDLVGRFRDMRSGAVLNRIDGWPSENRQVLHTSSRDLYSDQPREPESAAQAKRELAKLERFLKEVDDQAVRGSTGKPFTTMVNIGIGGSDLGPRAVNEALHAWYRPGRQVRFVANVDPDDAAAVLTSLDLSETLVNVVSKSGTTLETLTNEELVRSAYRTAGLDPARHFLSVTGVGSPMEDPQRYLRSFSMFDSIGGRYSTTSMVGCVTLGFALGMEQLQDFLRGASAMDDAAEKTQVRDNLPLLLALLGIWNRNFLGYPTLAILPYSQALHRFPAHLQQCDMESNGKSITRTGEPVALATGPIVWGEPGTNGQHAFYQLLHQGTEIVPAEFIGFQDSQYDRDVIIDGTKSQQKLIANLLAQAVALASGRNHENPNRRFAGNRPSSIIVGRRLDPRTMGSLLALYEAKIVLQGFVWQINSFDQEGVQLGKQLATELLGLMKSGENDGSSIVGGLLRELEK